MHLIRSVILVTFRLSRDIVIDLNINININIDIDICIEAKLRGLIYAQSLEIKVCVPGTR